MLSSPQNSHLLICSMRYFVSLLSVIVLSVAAFAQSTPFKQDSVVFFDATRNRAIPVELYVPSKEKKAKVVIVSHGYGFNKGGDNRAYSYLTEALAASGYLVASIQHELPTDDLLPLTGVPQVVRRPNWERGATNILFVISELKKRLPQADYRHVTLIGHSNGGDMSMLFAHQHPTLISKVISLDNRRMPFPRTRHPQIYSLRSSDQPADDGVLPTLEEQAAFGITVVKLPNTIHNNMDDSANESQRKEIIAYVLSFLKE